MAVILQENYTNGHVIGLPEPILYVDTINDDGFIAEMQSIILRYIMRNSLVHTLMHKRIV
jgi:hypothetical protein